MADAGRKKSKRADVKSLAILRKMQKEADRRLLSQEQTNVLLMRYSGATVREIMEALHISRQTVYDLLESGQKKIVAYMKEYER